MTSKRPGAPRSARRPVPASGGRRAGGAPGAGPSARGSRASGRASSAGTTSDRHRGPAAASRPRTTSSCAAAEDGPGITITRRTLVLVTLVVVALAALVPTINSYVAQRQQLAALHEQVSQQQDEVDELQSEVDRWQDPAFVAAQARERLLFAMPGETQYRLTDTSGRDVPLTEDEKAVEASASGEWFSTLWDSLEGASRLTAEDIPDETGSDSPEDAETTDPADPADTPTPSSTEDATP
ncbi:septum formation initiator family protein [Brachybacterium rhamnosum]|uniref:Septum formation initiator family protein n=1 Tax=Brachybacterium rhamnosum TaxID=173361 RepID=A0ABW4PTK3_9MICO